MNEKQQKSLIKAYLSLEKNFDHVVIIICEKEKPGSFVQPDPIVHWSGGLIPAKHLVQDAVTKMDRRKITRSPPIVDQKIMDSLKRKKPNEKTNPS